MMATLRRFELVDGKSSKFWEICVDGTNHTVNYGRIGTKGQSKTKSFDSVEQAEKEGTKLINAKVKKGYSEVGSKEVSSPPQAKPAPEKPSTVKKETKVTIKKAAPAEPLPTLTLPPEATRWRTWETYTPLPKPKEREFDAEMCAYLGAIACSNRKIVIPGFGDKPISCDDYYNNGTMHGMSRGEAIMWLVGCQGSGDMKSMISKKTWLEFIEEIDSITPTYDLYINAMKSDYLYASTPFYLSAFKLLSLKEFVFLLCAAETPDINSNHSIFRNIRSVDTFRDYIWPYLSPNELEAMRNTLQSYLEGPAFKSNTEITGELIRLSGYLGLHDWTRKFTRHFLASGGETESDDPCYPYKSSYYAMVEASLCLPECDQVLALMASNNIRLGREHQYIACLAVGGINHPDIFINSIARYDSKTDVESELKDFLKIASVPEAVPIIFGCSIRTKATFMAREWIRKHADWSIPYLRDVASSDSREKADAEVLLCMIDPDFKGPSGDSNLEVYDTVEVKVSKKKAKVPKVTEHLFPKGYSSPNFDLPPDAQVWVTYSGKRFRKEFPDPRPFDFDKSVKRINKQSWYRLDFDFSASASKEEAVFFAHAIISYNESRSKGISSSKNNPNISITKTDLKTAPPLENVLAAASKRELISNKGFLACLLKIYDDVESIIKQLLEEHIGWCDKQLVPQVRYHFAAYLSNKQFKTCQETLRKPYKLKNKRSLMPWYLASIFGLHQECADYLKTWKKYQDFPKGSNYYWEPADIIFGLGSREEVLNELTRLAPPIYNLPQVHALFAHLGMEGAVFLEAAFKVLTDKDDVKRFFTQVLDKVHSPYLAEALFNKLDIQKLVRPIRSWLDSHPVESIAALLCVATGTDNRSTVAQQYLRKMSKKGKRDLILEMAALHGPEVKEWIENTISLDYSELIKSHKGSKAPKWFDEAVADVYTQKKSDLPVFVVKQLLPELKMGERALNPYQVKGVLRGLKLSTLEKSHPIVTMVRDCIAPANRGAFAWALFEQWQGDGAPAKERWAMTALGLLGDDGCVMKLVPMIRRWPGEAQHARAVMGLDCLRAIGTDTALMQINGIAQKVKFKGIKNSAQEAMEVIANELELTREALEDRIVPDCGLDENGSRLFDFGPRSFRFVLSPDLKPVLRDESGAIKKDLPKPGKNDDAEKAETAVAEWKLLKKMIRDSAKIQSSRLEQTMVTGRRWPLDEFQLFIVDQPLMINFARMLLWGVYNEKGELLQTFRVTEDRTFGDAEDEETTLPENSQVGLVHSFELANDLRNKWGELFADYEILPPFPQLDREVFSLNEEEKSDSAIKRWEHTKVNPVKYVRPVDNMGWMHGTPEDAGSVHCHLKTFVGAQVTALVNYEMGYCIGYIEEDMEMEMGSVEFYEGIVRDDWPLYKIKPMKLKDVPPIVISEVIRDLQTVIKKAKVKVK